MNNRSNSFHVLLNYLLDTLTLFVVNEPKETAGKLNHDLKLHS